MHVYQAGEKSSSVRAGGAGQVPGRRAVQRELDLSPELQWA